jgi:hypothetical protein
LAKISRQLPVELVNIATDSSLSLASKVNESRNVINEKFGTERGIFWKSKRVDWNLEALPFYIHLWSKPDLSKRAADFGIARIQSLHSILLQKKDTIKTLKFTNKLTLLCCLTLSIGSYYTQMPEPIITGALCLKALFGLYMLHLNGKIMFTQRQIDQNALEITKDPEGAEHYLKSVDNYLKSGIIWKIDSLFLRTANQNKRLENLSPEIKKYKQLAQNTLSARLSLNVISSLFWKIIQFFTFPFQYLKFSNRSANT